MNKLLGAHFVPASGEGSSSEHTKPKRLKLEEPEEAGAVKEGATGKSAGYYKPYTQ